MTKLSDALIDAVEEFADHSLDIWRDRMYFNKDHGSRRFWQACQKDAEEMLTILWCSHLENDLFEVNI